MRQKTRKPTKPQLNNLHAVYLSGGAVASSDVDERIWKLHNLTGIASIL